MFLKLLTKKSLPPADNPFRCYHYTLSSIDLSYKYWSEDHFYRIGFKPYSKQKA